MYIDMYVYCWQPAGPASPLSARLLGSTVRYTCRAEATVLFVVVTVSFVTVTVSFVAVTVLPGRDCLTRAGLVVLRTLRPEH